MVSQFLRPPRATLDLAGSDAVRASSRKEIIGVGALEHEHLDGPVGLGSLNEGDQIADQFGPHKIHGRGRNFHEQNAPVLTHGERLENHLISPLFSSLIAFDIFTLL